MIHVLRDNPGLRNRVHVRNIDPDTVSLERGKQLVEKLGLDDCFSFHPVELRNVTRRKADFLLVSGIFCPLPVKHSTRVMKILRRYVRENGFILYNATTHAMIKGDPLTDFIMRIAGWEMDYKSEQEVFDIAVDGGWTPVSTFFEDQRFNAMVTARA